MVDTRRSLADLQALLADNASGDISEQDARDFLVSVYRGTPSVLVAASNASQATQDRADFPCNGTADEVDIQAAIDSLTSGGGVVLSEGTFNLAGSITDGDLDNISVIGQGRGTVLRLSTNANATMFAFDDAREGKIGWSFYNFRMDGNSANQSSPTDVDLMRFRYGEHFRVVDVIADDSPWGGIILDQMLDSHLRGVEIDTAADMGFYVLNASVGVSIIGCTVKGAKDLAQIRVDYGPTDVSIIGNTVSSSGINLAGVLVSSTSGATKRVTVMGNTIDMGDQTGFGLNITDAATVGVVVQGNTILNCNQGLLVAGSGVITGNNINDSENRGMYVSGGPWNITENSVDTTDSAVGANGDCIRIDGVDDCIISGNRSRNAAASGIRLLSADQTIVVGNICTGNTDYGISEDAQSNNNVVMGNDLTGNSAAPALLSGTGTITRNNLVWITENSGSATLVNGQTSIAVTHGLSVTPVAGDVMVTPIEAWGSMTEFYIDTYTSTQFTIHSDQDPGQDVDFVWKAVVL